MLIKFLRKNIGIIVAFIGFVLLVILTFGDLAEIMTDEYWHNVLNNITAISFVSLSLTMIQVTIKQGLAEQALQKGLNTERASQKYEEHRNLIDSMLERMMYLPYFLQSYNNRHTALRKREFLVNNNFNSEKTLYLSKNRRLIHKYRRIRTYIKSSDIKWATTAIVYNKYGRIETLKEHKTKRLIKGILNSIFVMVAMVFITDSLFLSTTDTPMWQKFVKLLTYVLTITISSVLGISKEYEKGAFGVPNELEEINEIWLEFKNWTIPDWVKADIEKMNEIEVKEDEQERTDSRRAVQKEQKESKEIKDISSDILLGTDSANNSLFDTNIAKFNR